MSFLTLLQKFAASSTPIRVSRDYMSEDPKCHSDATESATAVTGTSAVKTILSCCQVSILKFTLLTYSV